jgi:hypothetical protein
MATGSSLSRRLPESVTPQQGQPVATINPLVAWIFSFLRAVSAAAISLSRTSAALIRSCHRLIRGHRSHQFPFDALGRDGFRLG